MNDLISRAMAINAIKEDKIDLTNPNVVTVFKDTGDFEKVETQVMTCDRHIEILKDLPSAQPERMRGRWMPGKVRHIKNGELRLVRECSECGAAYFVYDYYNSVDEIPKYCPNCGADMRGEADED